jgi:hypothetical protein
MAFTQIKRIKEVDQTTEQAIESYGSFVNLYEKTRARVSQSTRKGWTPDRIMLNRAKLAVPIIHQAIADKFGQSAVYKAIDSHPFA